VIARRTRAIPTWMPPAETATDPRETRSASWPAGRARSGSGRNWARPTSPRSSGRCRIEYTCQPIATTIIWVANPFASSAIQRSAKPRSRSAGGRRCLTSANVRLREGGGETRNDGGQARVAGGAARGGASRRQREGRRTPPRRGAAPRPRARREALRPGFVRRARPLRPPPRIELRDDGSPPVRRRGRHGLRLDLRPQGLRLLAGLHGLRWLAQRGLRREDLQGDGPG